MRNKIYIVFILINLIITQISIAQINADSLLQVASEFAMDEDYTLALELAGQVLEEDPGRFDALIFAANVHAWDGDYLTAKDYIQKAQLVNKESNELYDSWLNILLWNKEYADLLDIADIAEENGYSNQYNLNLKRLYAYQSLYQFDKAINHFEEEDNKQLLDSSNLQVAYDNMLILRDSYIADSIYLLAKKEVKLGNYTTGIGHAKSVLEIFPERNEVILLIANSYAWQSKYDSAKIYIAEAYENDPKNPSLYDTWLNTLLWNSEYNEVLIKANLAEENDYSNQYNLALKRLYSYNDLVEYDSAISLFETKENKVLLDSTPLFNVYRDVLIKSKKNTITGYYSIDLYDDNNPNPQHLAYIDYGFKIKKHSLIFRLNYANRFHTNGLQLEADYYHVLKKAKYFYFNYGISILNDVFPQHRAGAEYYFPLSKRFEASFGARYMYFSNKHVPILTAHVSTYVNKLWFAIRPFYTFDENGNSISLIGNVRLFGDISYSYWGIELAYGNSPDERYLLNPTGDYFTLNSYRVKLEKSLMVTATNDLKISFGFAYEETAKSVFRNRYTIELIYKHRL